MQGVGYSYQYRYRLLCILAYSYRIGPVRARIVHCLVFSPCHFGLECTKVRVGNRNTYKILSYGWGRIFGPLHLPNFGHRDLKFFRHLEIYGTHIQYEFHDPNPNNGAWWSYKLKNHIFWLEGHILSLVTDHKSKRDFWVALVLKR